jgi:aminoglycoside 3-N-acetyltransferase
MITYPNLKNTFSQLGLVKTPVIAHASLGSFGEQVDGGAEAVVRAMLASFQSLIMPTHTYKTMITPLAGPDQNALVYGKPDPFNADPQIFNHAMPADILMGVIPETLRLHLGATRSMHPILSFSGINADAILAAQTLADPLAPIGALAEQNGWVVLVGVNHTSNTSMHYAEKLAGRKQFIRWALAAESKPGAAVVKLAGRDFSSSSNGLVVPCPGFPGCSAGFQVIMPDLEKYTRRARVGKSLIMAVPLAVLFHVVLTKLRQDPLSLLCFDQRCERCAESRRYAIEEQIRKKQQQ